MTVMAAGTTSAAFTTLTTFTAFSTFSTFPALAFVAAVWKSLGKVGHESHVRPL